MIEAASLAWTERGESPEGRLPREVGGGEERRGEQSAEDVYPGLWEPAVLEEACGNAVSLGCRREVRALISSCLAPEISFGQSG